MKNTACPGRNGWRNFALPGGSFPRALLALSVIFLFGLSQAAPLYAQQGRSKVPIVGKLSSGNRQQAYSGKVRSLDLKRKILNVNSLHGQDSEIFPIKKNVRVENLGGGKMKLDALTPGTTVLIYYNQKSGERTLF
jgi:hypothetical protein